MTVTLPEGTVTFLRSDIESSMELVRLPGTFDATVGTLRRMRTVEVDSCFAEWWAHEYVSLKLSALFTLYMQESTTDQVKVAFTGWLADRLHQDASRIRSPIYDDCA